MRLTLLITLCLVLFMVIMDTTIVNVALPSIKAGLHTDISWLQWVVAGYILTFACLLLTAGHMGDQFGEKKLLQWGMTVFIIASLCCGISTSVELLILFRLLQGIAAAFIIPTSLGLISNAFPDGKAYAKAVGVWGATGGIAAATGPILGATLITLFSWHAIFFVNVPIGLVCLLLIAQYINSSPKRQQVTFDIAGQILGIISIAVLVLSLIEVGRFGWTSAIVIVGFCVFVITFLAFIRVESRVTTPMLPLTFFKSNCFSAAVIIGFIINVGFYGEFFVLPFYFQHVRGYTVLMTGFALLPLMIIVALSSYVSGKLMSIIGFKLPIVSGLVLGTIGFLGTLWVIQSMHAYWTLVLPFVMIGFGISFTMPAITVAVTQSVPSNRIGIAAGVLNTTRQIGGLIGVAIFGSIITTSSHFMVGMRITLLVAAAVFVCGCIIAVLMIKNVEVQDATA